MGHFIKLLSSLAILLFAIEASAQNSVKVSGVVTDKYAGDPLIGATVSWDNGKGTTTDTAGCYSITVEAGATVSFMYLGYQSREWRVPTGVSEVNYNAELEQEVHMAEEVVVVAYGTRKKVQSQARCRP